MLKKFTMTTMAAAVAFTGMTAAPVQANNNEDLAKFLFGAVAIYAITQGVKHEKSTSTSKVHPTRPHTDTKRPAPHSKPKHPTPHKHPTYARITPLPVQCLAQFETAHGTQRYFGQSCLRERYVGYRILPKNCETTIWSSRGKREVFSPRCLKENGFEL